MVEEERGPLKRERVSVTRVSVTRRLSDVLLRERGVLKIWLENFARGSGCCCGAAVVLILMLILTAFSSPFWMPALPLPMPGFEGIVALAALAALAFFMRRK